MTDRSPTCAADDIQNKEPIDRIKVATVTRCLSGDYYHDGTKETRKIDVFVKIDSILDEDIVDKDKKRTVIRILVRNSNIDNIPVFENLEAVFNYTQFHSTKRNQHREVSGALGDYLKRGLGMGYALWTNDFNRESLTANSKQWPEPIILRFNGQEHKVFLEVDWDNQAYGPKYEQHREYNAPGLYRSTGYPTTRLYPKNKLGSR